MNTTLGKPIKELTAARFQQCKRILLWKQDGGMERFITTRIGRVIYAVSLDTAQSSTRPQLLASNVGAIFEVTSL